MKNYKVEELKLLNCRVGNSETSFPFEHEFSLEEKLAFLDEHSNGEASFIYNALEKYEEDSKSLKKDSLGYVKTMSMIGWIKRNGMSEIMDIEYKYGQYYFYGKAYRLSEGRVCGRSEFGCSHLYTGRNIILQWYHDLLLQLRNKERQFFIDNDPLHVALKELLEVSNRNVLFDNEKLNTVIWNRSFSKGENYTLEELKSWIKAYKDLNSFVSNYKFEEVI